MLASGVGTVARRRIVGRWGKKGFVRKRFVAALTSLRFFYDLFTSVARKRL